MLEFLRTELLQPAEDAIIRGDYGTALYNAIVANTVAIRILKDGEAAIISHDLASLVSRLIEADFEAIAEQRGLTVTPENRAALLQEHSPHYIRFRGLLTQPIFEPIPEILYNESKIDKSIIKPYKNLNESFFDKIPRYKLYNEFKEFKKK